MCPSSSAKTLSSSLWYPENTETAKRKEFALARASQVIICPRVLRAGSPRELNRNFPSRINGMGRNYVKLSTEKPRSLEQKCQNKRPVTCCYKEVLCRQNDFSAVGQCRRRVYNSFLFHWISNKALFQTSLIMGARLLHCSLYQRLTLIKASQSR